MEYNKEYFKKLDNEVKMIPLTYDFAFKAVMMKNIGIFKKFLIETLNLDISEDETNLFFLDKELIKENYKEKGKMVDLNVKIGEHLLVTVEVNRYDFNTIKERNQLFLEKLHTLQFEVGEEYKVLKSNYLYQLNLNVLDSYKNTGENIIVSYDITNHSIYNDKVKTYIKHLAYYYEMVYNNIELMKYDEIFMAGLMSDSFSKLYNIMNHILSKSEINRFMESVINMSKEYINIHEWEKEKMDKLVQDTAKRLAQEEGHKEGHEKGLKEGLEEGRKEGRKEGKIEGIKQNKEEIIKRLLQRKYDYKEISEITNVTIEEIKKIEETMEK